MYTVYLGLGSNIGDRLRFISGALERISEIAIIQAISPVYETEPVDVASKDNFFNLVVEVKTMLVPSVLLPKLKLIENNLGRTPCSHMKPREIDIDILMYEDKVFHDGNVDVPHPRMTQRRFVLTPFCDIAAEVMHPVLNKSIRQLLDACVDKSSVVRTIHKITIPQLT
jgi:2-amino-4-hydroxy-6-hydroxymethyldihydropteridine diphosphokinase